MNLSRFSKPSLVSSPPIAIILTAVWLALSPSILFGQEGKPNLPNLIIMMADDMGMGDTSAYLGKRLTPRSAPISKTVRTPHLERLAQTGVLFTDAHAPASMCSSTRYSLLTGRFAHRAYLKKQGWLPHGPNTPMIQQALTTLPEMLKKRGYDTAAIGKYHVGMAFSDGHGGVANEFDYRDVDFNEPILDGPTHHGFDEFFGVPGNTEDPLDTEPRIYIRNRRWVFTDRSGMKSIGMKKLVGRILAAPDWDLAQLGADYLREALAYIDRRSASQKPFFLYYAPNANHYQRNATGRYAVPDSIAGHPVKGRSRYTDGSRGGDREDMILENDLALSQILKKLRTTKDPRAPHQALIENTLVIFTSDNGPNTGDNLGRNQESGGLRGKKAKLWEGGLRVPFIASLPGTLDGGRINRTFFSHTDLYATLAGLAGAPLSSSEAQDSHDVLPWWTGRASEPDPRPRVFFCHLGPPYSNDALAIRRGQHKLVVEGGLAMPWIGNSKRGASIPVAYYNLEENPYEDGGEGMAPRLDTAQALALSLLEIHNQGHSRDLGLSAQSTQLILDAGWHNPRNDVTGEIGFEFAPRHGIKPPSVTHLGMWNAHPKDHATRAARALPDESGRDQAGRTRGGRTLVSEHTVRLVQLRGEGTPTTLAKVRFTAESPGTLEGAFRYLALKNPVTLEMKNHYVLLVSTRAGDGDPFRDPASFDGLSPLVHPDFKVLRSLLIRNGDLNAPQPIPAFADLDPSYDRFRLPVGPTLRAKSK